MGGAPFYKILSKKRLQCRREARPQIKPALLPLPTFCPKKSAFKPRKQPQRLALSNHNPGFQCIYLTLPPPFQLLAGFYPRTGKGLRQSLIFLHSPLRRTCPAQIHPFRFFGKPHLRKCRPGGTIRHSQQPAGPVASSRLPCIFRTAPGLARNGSEALPCCRFSYSPPFSNTRIQLSPQAVPLPPGCVQADKKRAGRMSGPKIIRLSASC